jgi:single-stranded DNA-binding protein
MSNQVTGRLVYIGQPQEIPSKSGGNPFVKCEFILDATTRDPYTGERSQYENILPLEVSGDKCAELDNYRVGDVITVSFALQGREWTNQDGQVKRMVSIRCYKLEARRPVQQVAQAVQPVQPTVQPAPQPAYQQFPPVDENGNIVEDPLPF